MKKFLATISALLILGALAGCNRKTSLYGEDSQMPAQSALENSSPPAEIVENLELQKISELRADLDRQIENVRNADYDNLHMLENCTVTIPETDVLYELELTQKEYTWQELYDRFDRVFDANFGDIYKDEDKAELYYAMAQEDEWSEEHGYEHITLAERRERFAGGELTPYTLEVTTDKAHLEMHCRFGGGYGIAYLFHDGVKNRANLSNSGAVYSSLYSYRAERLFNTVKEAADVNSDDRYELLDGEISVSEAAGEVTRILNEYGCTWGGDLELGIYEYRVYDIGGGKYGLEFDLAPFYKGVMLDSDEAFPSPSDGYNWLSHDYSLYRARVLMIESGKIESFTALSGGDGEYGVAELGEYDSVIPLEKAVEIASEKFGAGLNLQLGSAELRYSKAYDKGEGRTIQGAFPVWKLTLESSTDGRNYITYINAATGEFEYY